MPPLQGGRKKNQSIIGSYFGNILRPTWANRRRRLAQKPGESGTSTPFNSSWALRIVFITFSSSHVPVSLLIISAIRIACTEHLTPQIRDTQTSIACWISEKKGSKSTSFLGTTLKETYRPVFCWSCILSTHAYNSCTLWHKPSSVGIFSGTTAPGVSFIKNN